MTERKDAKPKAAFDLLYHIAVDDQRSQKKMLGACKELVETVLKDSKWSDRMILNRVEHTWQAFVLKVDTIWKQDQPRAHWLPPDLRRSFWTNLVLQQLWQYFSFAYVEDPDVKSLPPPQIPVIPMEEFCNDKLYPMLARY